ncbi:MAG: hypothetical protein ACI9XO_003579 [Paraglaciecola sp.]|jgi:hypothetical protein
MKIFTKTFLFFFVILGFQAQAQEVVEVNFLGNTSMAELQAIPGIGTFVKNGVDSYEVIYTTNDLEGNVVNVSGLLCVPDDGTKRYPLLCYAHGTSSGPDDVPSDPANGNAQLTRTWCAFGYVAVAPDLLGLGVHEGVHPFVHADSEAWVAADMMKAIRAYGEDNDIFINDQVFTTGYSQGGHSSMALHRELELNQSAEFTVTAASHQSGPYSISGVMRDLLFIEEDYGFVAYLPNTAIAYEEVYGNLYDELSDIFKPQYVDMIQQFADDEMSLFDLNLGLIDTLIAYNGVAAPGKMFKDSLVMEVQNNFDHPFNVALRDNDVYDWAPTAPTQILYCEADDQVPFMNSVIANDTMLANGSTTVILADVNSDANHTECVIPAFTSAFFLFSFYQNIEDVVATHEITFDLPFQLFPNPADDKLTINDLPENGEMYLTDMSGRQIFKTTVHEGNQEIDLSTISTGVYLVQIVGEATVWQQRLMVR